MFSSKPLSQQQENALELLRLHTPLDEEERADCVRMTTFITAHGNCYGEDNPVGHITGSAFVLDPQGRVLMTFHGKLQRWLQLGGHSDSTETSPAETALREAREESGLGDLMVHPCFGPGPVDIDIHVIPARRDEPEHEHLDFRFVFLTKTPESIVISSESTGLRWWPLTPFPDLGLDGALVRALGKVRGSIASGPSNKGSQIPGHLGDEWNIGSAGPADRSKSKESES